MLIKMQRHLLKGSWQLTHNKSIHADQNRRLFLVMQYLLSFWPVILALYGVNYVRKDKI